MNKIKCELKSKFVAGCQWLTPVILATQEAEISKPAWANSLRDPILEKNPSQTKKEKRAHRMARKKS
jgi:hypothetical protein